MHVRVDQAGHDREARGVDRLGVGMLQVGAELDDAAVPDAHVDGLAVEAGGGVDQPPTRDDDARRGGVGLEEALGHHATSWPADIPAAAGTGRSAALASAGAGPASRS